MHRFKRIKRPEKLIHGFGHVCKRCNKRIGTMTRLKAHERMCRFTITSKNTNLKNEPISTEPTEPTHTEPSEPISTESTEPISTESTETEPTHTENEPISTKVYQNTNRQCGIAHLDVPVNPCYLQKYGGVSVRDAIDNAFNAAWERAELLASRRGQSEIYVDPWHDVSSDMEHYLNLKLQCLDILVSRHNNCYESTIRINENYGGKVVEIRQAHFHNGLERRNIINIPTHWNDSEPEWTWEDVCNNGQYYSTSSHETWPRPEYKVKAMEEQMRKATAERRQRYLNYNYPTQNSVTNTGSKTNKK